MLFSNRNVNAPRLGTRLRANRPGGVSALLVIGSAAVFGLAFVLGLTLANLPSSVEKTNPTATGAREGGTRFQVRIRKPDGPPRVSTGIHDIHGQPVTVSCSTCHASRQPNFDNKTVADVNEFHVGLTFSHGSISCLSCHNSSDYDALKLADGTRVEFSDVMTLCAQCHGPQMEDYQHNAHGGMVGFWDLSRGDQEKNNCVDCHQPHSPQFPTMVPTFKPKDRFLESKPLPAH